MIHGWLVYYTISALFLFCNFSILFIEMFFLVLFYFSLSAGYYERLSLFFLPSPYFKTTKNGEEEMRNLVWRRLVKKKGQWRLTYTRCSKSGKILFKFIRQLKLRKKKKFSLFFERAKSFGRMASYLVVVVSGGD